MRQVTLIARSNGAFCRRTLQYMRELQRQPRFRGVRVQVLYVDSDTSELEQFDYYYLPAIYLGERRMVHGVCTRQEIYNIFLAAIK